MGHPPGSTLKVQACGKQHATVQQSVSHAARYCSSQHYCKRFHSVCPAALLRKQTRHQGSEAAGLGGVRQLKGRAGGSKANTDEALIQGHE